MVDKNQQQSASGRMSRYRRSWTHFFVIFFLAIILIAVFFIKEIVVIIRSGEAGALWRRFSGAEIDRVYGEGLRIISPFDRMTVYEVRNQIANHDLTVLSKDGLKINLELTIRYHPQLSLLGVLHDRVGPEYLTKVVIPQTESALRKNLGNATAEQIYTNENNLLNDTMLETIEAIGRNFIVVEDIIIRKIQLPEIVRKAIEDKLIQQEVLASYAFRGQIAVQEAKRKRIEAQGIRDYNEMVDSTLTPRLLYYQGINVTTDIAESENEKTVIIGTGSGSPPIVLSTVPRMEMPPTENRYPQEAQK